MELIAKYREIILEIFEAYTKVPSTYGDLEDEIIIDRQTDRYLWMTRGWQKHKRIHACVARVDIIDGKLWIQHDNTEEGIAIDLERYGVPKEHIVLGFRSPELRKYTGYAAA